MLVSDDESVTVLVTDWLGDSDGVAEAEGEPEADPVGEGERVWDGDGGGELDWLCEVDPLSEVACEADALWVADWLGVCVSDAVLVMENDADALCEGLRVQDSLRLREVL